jgi:renal tumor antigen
VRDLVQVNNLREIQALRRLSPHEHIISLEEVLYDQPTGRLALVFELMDANLYELIRGENKPCACVSIAVLHAVR